ncbi:11415_t:CDS:1, partial [Racocetra fulgida]
MVFEPDDNMVFEPDDDMVLKPEDNMMLEPKADNLDRSESDGTNRYENLLQSSTLQISGQFLVKQKKVERPGNSSVKEFMERNQLIILSIG